MKPVVIGVSGRVASGKSSIVAVLAERLGVPQVAFGDYIRHVASFLGLDANDRLILQDIGGFLVRYPNSFCKNLLQFANYEHGSSLIVDGIRHVEVIEELRRLVAPVQIFHVHVDASEETIKERLKKGRSNVENLQDIERHETELQVITRLPEIADFRLANIRDRSLVTVTDELILGIFAHCTVKV